MSWRGSHDSSFAPLLIALEQGYFATEGLDREEVPLRQGRLRGHAGRGGEPGDGRPDTIIVRKDRIAATSGLAGKIVGTSFGTTAHFYLDTYLSSVGVAKSRVKIVNVSAKDLPAALQAGAVDAIATFEPYAHQALQLLPGGAMRLSKVEILKETFNLVVMKDSRGSIPRCSRGSSGRWIGRSPTRRGIGRK